MAIIETEFRRFKIDVAKQITELKRIIITRMIKDTWVQQDVACAILNIKSRQLANIRVHMKDGVKVGCISWKKGKGKNCLYYMPDIEKYNAAVTIMN
jgi:hypothetical protein